MDKAAMRADPGGGVVHLVLAERVPGGGLPGGDADWKVEMDNRAVRVTQRDIELALRRVEDTLGADLANLLRSYWMMLEAQLRVYRAGDDEVQD